MSTLPGGYQPSEHTSSPAYRIPDAQQPPPAQAQPAYTYPPPQPVVVVRGPSTSAWSVASLVFGILGALGGFCFLGIPCLAAIVCGHAGLIDAKNGRPGKGAAVAGLILGYLFLAFAGYLYLTGTWQEMVDEMSKAGQPR